MIYDMWYMNDIWYMIYIYMCVYIIYIYMCVYIRMYMCVYIRISIYCIYICVYIYMYTCIYMYTSYMRVYIYIIYIYISTCISFDMLHDMPYGMLHYYVLKCHVYVSQRKETNIPTGKKKQEGGLWVEDDLCDKAIVWNLGSWVSNSRYNMCNLWPWRVFKKGTSMRKSWFAIFGG